MLIEIINEDNSRNDTFDKRNYFPLDLSKNSIELKKEKLLTEDTRLKITRY